MKHSCFKQTIALLLTLAFASAYMIGSADGARTVYAAAAAGSASAQTSQASAPTITTQPKNVTAAPGDTVKFTVAAKGTGTLKYQWYIKKDGASSWTAWNGHTTATTSASANATWNMMQVRCKVTDANGSVYSSAATVTINQALTITAQPKSVTVTAGTDVTFSVTAQGCGKMSYQWYYKKSGASSWAAWGSRTTASTTATANASWNLMQVRCEIADSTGAKVTSKAATITIDQPLMITAQPESITVKTGAEVKFSVTAQGTGKLTYQWYYKKTGGSWTAWGTRTSASTTATANASWNLMQVRCEVADSTGAKVTSKAATVTLDQPLKITTQPKDIQTKAGATVKFSIAAEGTGAVKYQWYYQKTGAKSASAWSGKTSASFSATADASWNGMKVYCKVTDAAGSTLKSNVITVIIPGKLMIATQPQDTTVLVGDTAKFSIKAYCENTIKYQWYYKKAGKSEWTLWSGKTTADISGTANCTWHGMQVYCKVTDSKGNTLKSSVAYALITKQSDKRYFTRYITAKENYTKVYDGAGIKNNVIGKIMTKNTYTALEWTSDANDTTWYCFQFGSKIAWVPRTGVNVKNDYISIPDRKFNDGGIPIIYISPSKQPDNAYAYGSTTEQEQMYRVGNALKEILDAEYYCQTYVPPTTLPLGLHSRAYDAYIRESDVYLAIHSNAVSAKNAYGAIGYYSPSCNQSKVLSQNIVNEMKKICLKKPNIQNQLREGMSAFGGTGYGEVRDPTYYGIVGVLAEVEYHDNKDSAKWIINNTDKIARALANALETTFGLQKKNIG